MPDDGPWRVRGSETVFRCPWFRIRRDDLTLPSGRETPYFVLEHGGYVVVVPLLDDGRVLMERIWRHTVGRALLECPSGSRDGDLPETAARRELEEETGHLAASMEHVGRFVGSSGHSNEEFDVYLARGVHPGGTLHREDTEQIELERIPLDDLRARVLRGELDDAPTALAVLLAWERVGRPRAP